MIVRAKTQPSVQKTFSCFSFSQEMTFRSVTRAVLPAGEKFDYAFLREKTNGSLGTLPSNNDAGFILSAAWPISSSRVGRKIRFVFPKQW